MQGENSYAFRSVLERQQSAKIDKLQFFILVALSHLFPYKRHQQKGSLFHWALFVLSQVCITLQLMCLVSRWCTTDIKHQQLPEAQALTGQWQDNACADINLSSVGQMPECSNQ